jgi:hypothetical protein
MLTAMRVEGKWLASRWVAGASPRSMLFLVSSDGVPSLAGWVRLKQ